jgi:hypothetical protein
VVVSKIYVIKVHHSYTINQIFNTPEDAEYYASNQLKLQGGKYTIFQFEFGGTYFLKDDDNSSTLRCMYEATLRYIGELFLGT